MKAGVPVFVHPAVDTTHDLDAVASLMACCDLIISVGNASAHLAGAIGRPTWALLPRVAGWRWLDHGNTCPWYRTLRLFRQERHGDWDSVLREVKVALQSELCR